MAKKNTKGIIIGVVAACAAIGALTPDKKVESIELSIPAYQMEYDINTEIPLDVSVLPDNAKTDAVKYVASSDSITFSGSTINTGADEGTFEIYAIAGDIESNILSINVTDISARNEAAAKAEEKRLAKAAEKQRLAEEKAAKEAKEKAAAEQAAREAEEKAIAEQAAREAEEQKAAEELAARETEEQILLATQSEKATLPNANVSDVAAQPESVQQEETAVVVETPAPEENTSTPVGEMVWLSATGEKYHRINNCGRMNPDKARQVSLEDALNRGYGKCSKCW